MPNEMDNVIIEEARLVLRNFAGKPDTFNAEGKRNFGVLLDDDVADAMARDGWEIKHFKVKEEGVPPQAWLKVHLRFDFKPPRCILLSTGSRTRLDEDTIDLLDEVDIRKVDMTIRPYRWTFSTGATGIKAMLKSIFVTIEEDDLDRKYADLDDLPTGGGRVR